MRVENPATSKAQPWMATSSPERAPCCSGGRSTHATMRAGAWRGSSCPAAGFTAMADARIGSAVICTRPASMNARSNSSCRSAPRAMPGSRCVPGVLRARARRRRVDRHASAGLQQRDDALQRVATARREIRRVQRVGPVERVRAKRRVGDGPLHQQDIGQVPRALARLRDRAAVDDPDDPFCAFRYEVQIARRAVADRKDPGAAERGEIDVARIRGARRVLECVGEEHLAVEAGIDAGQRCQHDEIAIAMPGGTRFDGVRYVRGCAGAAPRRRPDNRARRRRTRASRRGCRPAPPGARSVRDRDDSAGNRAGPRVRCARSSFFQVGGGAPAPVTARGRAPEAALFYLPGAARPAARDACGDASCSRQVGSMSVRATQRAHGSAPGLR